MKIDIYTHVVPPKYKTALAKVASTIDAQLRVPSLYDMDQRLRTMDRFADVKKRGGQKEGVRSIIFDFC